MPKINDWNRKYWRNKDGSTVSNPDERQLPDDILALYENARGDIVTYGYAGEDAPGDYVVKLNGSPVEDITLKGEKFDEAEFEVLAFSTRGSTREAATQLMRQLPPLTEDEDGEIPYSTLQDWAKAIGVTANKSSEELEEEIVA